MLFDRLYGKITFPEIIGTLLTCPGLLRLREIRLGNVPFLAFPSFSTCTRYEHSIGVCHLAELAAQTLAFNARDRIGLMIASLYHDVATPPFGHTVEEVLREKYGFNHEEHLHDLITGRTDDLGKERAQIFQGRGLKLQISSQKSEFRKLGLDLFEIADFAVGKGKLGSLVNGTVDLDNIDNVVRAASALGIPHADARIAKTLATSFVSSGRDISLAEKSLQVLEIWQRLRHRLYSLIYRDVKDFSLETMIRHAVKILIDAEIENGGLRKEDWRLTEQEIICDRFMRNPVTSRITERMRNADVYSCLALFSVSTTNIDAMVPTFLKKLEEQSSDFFGFETIGNYFFDQRFRSRKIHRLYQSLTKFITLEETIKKSDQMPKLIIGVFTPQKASEVSKMKGITEFRALVSSLLPRNSRTLFHLYGKKRLSPV